MNEFREIVTKAVVSKGKKEIYLNPQIETKEKPYSILGCWIINHTFDAVSNDHGVDLNGSFEINIWYSSNNNTKTDVIREKVSYTKDIKTKRIVKEYLDDSEEILAKILQHPSATSIKINDLGINLEIMFEVLVEVIGETKMQVTVFNAIPTFDDEIEDLDIEIDENFLNK